jgi:hypothetical protein
MAEASAAGTAISEEELAYRLAFARMPRIGSRRTELLEAHFPNLVEA